MEKENYSRLNKKTLRTFCISFSIGMLLIAIFSILRQMFKGDSQINFIPAIITGILSCYHQIAAWVVPDNPSLRKPHFAIFAMLFFYITNAIWKIVTLIIGTVVFGIIFYLIFNNTAYFFGSRIHVHWFITSFTSRRRWRSVPSITFPSISTIIPPITELSTVR